MLPTHYGAVIPVDHECGFLRTRSRLKRSVCRSREGGSLEGCEQALAPVRHSAGYGLCQEHHDVGAGVVVQVVTKVLLTPTVEVMRVVRMLPLCRDLPVPDVALAAAQRRRHLRPLLVDSRHEVTSNAGVCPGRCGGGGEGCGAGAFALVARGRP